MNAHDYLLYASIVILVLFSATTVGLAIYIIQHLPKGLIDLEFRLTNLDFQQSVLATKDDIEDLEKAINRLEERINQRLRNRVDEPKQKT